LFIHRDAENQGREVRVEEITQALAMICFERRMEVPSVFVIPVRMQEAWLLIDESSIRRAAGNPSGRIPLNVPQRRHVETVADPKETLYGLLRTASGLTGRRLRRLDLAQSRYRLAELIADFSPLRDFPAFAALDRDVTHVLAQNHWT
jgi:hypothetical protein